MPPERTPPHRAINRRIWLGVLVAGCAVLLVFELRRNGAFGVARALNQATTVVAVQPAQVIPQAPAATQHVPTALATRSSASRSAIQQQYESWGFTFADSTLADGRPRTTGTSPEGWVVVELVGQADSVTEASAMLTPADDAAQQQKNTQYIAALLDLTAPAWSKGATWLGSNLNEVLHVIQRGEPTAERVFASDNHEARIRTHVMSGRTMVIVTVDHQ